MKTSLVRGFVVALAIVGFTASSVAASHSASKTSKIGSVPQTAGSTPLCAPSDPSHCGLD
jgi:hypothetical protein